MSVLSSYQDTSQRVGSDSTSSLINGKRPKVLFLERTEVEGHSDCYERLGVGALFRFDVDSLFEAAGEEHIWLV